MLYLPPDCEYRVTATTGGADLAVVAAPAIHSGEPLLFSPEQMRATRHGAGPWGRKIYMGITESPAPQRLMVGETFNRPGGWTSYPPHKHDAPNPPQEMPYEEVYFFLLKPAAGFALQRIYDPPECANRRDIALVVRNGDAVVIPRGYHPVIGTPGYQLYYLWMLCGDVGNRTYGQSTLDPDHAWLNQVEPLLEDPAHAH
jgi:5-deoxy-glucuronate isomerase